MTEEEAKGKWCPMVRANLHGVNTLVGTNNAMGDAANCIGSACMMWRVHLVADDISPIKYIPKGGYCGLAGAP